MPAAIGDGWARLLDVRSREEYEAVKLPGAELTVSFYHFDLLAPAPATAHVAVWAGEHLMFEREIAIPGKADVYEVELVADFSAPAGTPVMLHLHNHGQNTWTFTSIQVEVENP